METYRVNYEVWSFVFGTSFQFTQEIEASSPEDACAKIKAHNFLAENVRAMVTSAEVVR